MVLVEAYAAGLPVVASRLGSMRELVDDQQTGAHFKAGDAADLATVAADLFSKPALLAHMGDIARGRYLARYSPEQNLVELETIYHQAVELSREIAKSRPSGA